MLTEIHIDTTEGTTFNNRREVEDYDDEREPRRVNGSVCIGGFEFETQMIVLPGEDYLWPGQVAETRTDEWIEAQALSEFKKINSSESGIISFRKVKNYFHFKNTAYNSEKKFFQVYSSIHGKEYLENDHNLTLEEFKKLFLKIYRTKVEFGVSELNADQHFRVKSQETSSLAQHTCGLTTLLGFKVDKSIVDKMAMRKLSSHDRMNEHIARSL